MEKEKEKEKELKKMTGPTADFFRSLGPGIWIEDECPLQSFEVMVDDKENVFRLE
jgi:hypothetical protein